jgi:Uncharacterized protein conserved in bacteria (DUF2252)
MYGRLCGWTLARAQARSEDRIAIARYLGKSDAFDQALLAFSRAYADQNERDYQALVKAVDSGRSSRKPDFDWSGGRAPDRDRRRLGGDISSSLRTAISSRSCSRTRRRAVVSGSAAMRGGL